MKKGRQGGSLRVRARVRVRRRDQHGLKCHGEDDEHSSMLGVVELVEHAGYVVF